MNGVTFFRQVLDCASLLALLLGWTRPKAAEDCRTPRRRRAEARSFPFKDSEHIRKERGSFLGPLVRCVLPTAICLSAFAAEPKRPELVSWFGKTPTLDGVITAGEWSDATEFRGVRDWVPEFSPVKDDTDLALRGWVKHDNQCLYFAFDITDDILYGIDTPRWLPPENPNAHELSPKGFPWFGDEMEILINAPNTWKGNEGAEGSGASWQMVCNLTKSRLGGVEVGGLLEGEPRSDAKAWATYQRWIQTKAQRAAARAKAEGKGYIIEWAIQFDPCLEISPGRFYSTALGEITMGLNIALGDLDTPEKGEGNFGRFHHEQWFAGAQGTRTQKNNFGTLRLMGKRRLPRRSR
jgi:SSS family solute:Na+ symporter